MAFETWYDAWALKQLLSAVGDRRLSEVGGRPEDSFFNKTARQPFFEDAELANTRISVAAPQQLASNSFGKRQGIVLDPDYRGEEMLFRDPTQEQQDKSLEKFHLNFPSPPIEDIQSIDPEFLEKFRSHFTG